MGERESTCDPCEGCRKGVGAINTIERSTNVRSDGLTSSRLLFSNWVIGNKVLLTKNNFMKRKWTGCQKCCACDNNETVDHLFLSCPFAKLIWRMVFFSYNIPPPSNITNMFGNWLNGVRKIDKGHIHIGISGNLLVYLNKPE